ncbi:MAG: hypothetical protein RIS94_2800 [Pseudomonadota bacterium]|jgi:S-adenosylmethionine-diacylgycerolhomoserine-N-methlytransferase
MASVASPSGHGALMDSIYRRQRHFYDLTRKYYLFGRDTMIAGLDCRPGMRVLEIGCGTGRNLDLIGKAWDGVDLHGLDISQEMLETARRRLGDNARLALGDATDFDPLALFGTETFDRVVISFAVSMIPQWRAAVTHAATLLAPGGSLHVVDFGDFSGMPGLFRTIMRSWLRRFHVTPRRDLIAHGWAAAKGFGYVPQAVRGRFGYFRLLILHRPVQ